MNEVVDLIPAVLMLQTITRSSISKIVEEINRLTTCRIINLIIRIGGNGYYQFLQCLVSTCKWNIITMQIFYWKRKMKAPFDNNMENDKKNT